MRIAAALERRNAAILEVAEEVERIVFAFDAGDDRQTKVRELAARLRAIALGG